MITTSRHSTYLLFLIFVLSMSPLAPSTTAAPVDDVSPTSQGEVKELGETTKSEAKQESAFVPSVHLLLGLQFTGHTMKEMNEELGTLRQEGLGIKNMTPEVGFTTGVRFQTTPSMILGLVYSRMGCSTRKRGSAGYASYDLSADLLEFQALTKISHDGRGRLYLGMGIAQIKAKGKVSTFAPSSHAGAIGGLSYGFRPIMEWQIALDDPAYITIQTSYWFANVQSAFTNSNPNIDYTLDFSGPSVSVSLNFNLWNR